MNTGEEVTDEVSAVQRLGVNIALLRNDEWNFKITIPRDLELAEHLLACPAGNHNNAVQLTQNSATEPGSQPSRCPTCRAWHSASGRASAGASKRKR